MNMTQTRNLPYQYWEAEVILANRARAQEAQGRISAFLNSIRASKARTVNPSQEMEMLTDEWNTFI